jgi:pyruvate carboxylase
MRGRRHRFCRSAFGIRLDAGTAYAGAIITRFYDSLLVKVTAWSPTPEETIARMHRALWEFRIRGVVTNLRFLDQLIMHPRFASADYTTAFIDQSPELFRSPRKRDRATRLLSFIGDVIVNGNPVVKGRARPKQPVFPRLPRITLGTPPAGTKRDHQRSARGWDPHGIFRAEWPTASDSGRGPQPGGKAAAAAQG